MGKPEVSVVLPCLNEAQTLETCIRKAQKAIEAHGLQAEVIVADNGSTDGSQAIAQKYGARVIQVSERGYGAAVTGGVAASQGTFVIMGDADDSYDFTQIFPFVEKLRDGYDFVVGCRFPWGGGRIMPGAMPWKHRWIGTPLLTMIGRVFFRSQVSDFNCGLRAFRRDACDRMDLRTTGMEFASEMIIKATLKGMNITELPITFFKDGRSRPPHLRSWRDGWRHLRFMLLFSPRWLFLYPGLLIMLLGLITGLLALFYQRAFGSVTFDVNALVYAAMAIVIGFQAIIFAVFTKIFAITEGLLPEDPRLNNMFRYINLEVGLIIGSTLLSIGLAGSIYGFCLWDVCTFDLLDRSKTLKIIIPAVTSLTLGFQIVLSSFFLSILGLRRR